MNNGNNELDPMKDGEEKFTNDPEEQLRIENELLRLKLQAETGANFQHMSDLPSDVENAFLNNILAFERQLDNAHESSIYTIIGEPKDFKPDIELTDAAITTELERLTNLLEKNQVIVDYGAAYPDRLKYKFITEELFEQQMQKFDIPGMLHHFIYEEFHPNHILSITGVAEDFLDMWLAQNIKQRSDLVSNNMLTRDAKPTTKEAFFQKAQYLFDAYTSFDNGTFSIDDVNYEMMPDAPIPTGFGYAEGYIQYAATLENKETQEVKGPFKLYVEFNGDYWSLMNVIMPGFEL